MLVRKTHTSYCSMSIESNVPSTLPEIHPPLQEVWKLSLDSESFIWAAPQIHDNAVCVRCGYWLACLDLLNGKLRWKVQVGREDFDNRICVSTRIAIITLSDRDDWYGLVAVSWKKGIEIWRSPLSGELMEYGLTANSQFLYAITTEDNNLSCQLYQINLKTGEVLQSLSIASGADHIVTWHENVVFGSASFSVEDAGLYIWDLRCKTPRRLLSSIVGNIRPGSSALLAAVEGLQEGAHEIIAFSSSTFEKLWSVLSYEFAMDTDAGQVAHLGVARRGKNQVILRDELTGQIIWQSKELEEEGSYIFFSKDAVCVQSESLITFFNRTTGHIVGHIKSPKWTFSWGAGISSGKIVLGHGSDVLGYASE